MASEAAFTDFGIRSFLPTPGWETVGQLLLAVLLGCILNPLILLQLTPFLWPFVSVGWLYNLLLHLKLSANIIIMISDVLKKLVNFTVVFYRQLSKTGYCSARCSEFPI